MYKLLLSWRYLRTRYLALASIVSVMLGVATLIVVNSVMGGFSAKLRDRMRGIQADITVASRSMDGVHFRTQSNMPRREIPFELRPLAERRLAEVKRQLGDKIEAVTPVVETFAMLQYRVHYYEADGTYVGTSEPITRPVTVIGIEPVGKSKTGEFAQHLLNAEHRRNPGGCFTLSGDALKRYEHRQRIRGANLRRELPGQEAPAVPGGPPPLETPSIPESVSRLYAAVVGYGIATYRQHSPKAGDDGKDVYAIRPGDTITLSTLTRQLEGPDGTIHPPRPKSADFIVTDLYKSEMAEFDANIIFVPLEDLQDLRAMHDHITSLQFKLADYARDRDEALRIIQAQFEPASYAVTSWEQRQGALLSAIAIERNLLNILLFLIIAVAGFGILAIFFMIVVEKTKDIGILKSLGASNAGVMGIFLSYGLALGIVGAGLGTCLGVAITFYINEIERLIAGVTGTDVFPRDVYYFDKIPVDLRLGDALLINAGAIAIAVLASIWPAARAARMHPVCALRYE